MQIRWAQISAKSYVDGPGQRAVLWMQGCRTRCPGCQNQHLWDTEGGASTSIETVVDALLGCNSEAVTITGGDPMLQPGPLAALVRQLKAKAPKLHIIVYTGFTWESLLDQDNATDQWPFVHLALQNIDVLVDGPYVATLDDDSQQWRGSKNQRVIDVNLSIKTGSVMTIDWQKPRLIVTPEGATYVAASYAALNRQQQAQDTRRCGQTN